MDACRRLRTGHRIVDTPALGISQLGKRRWFVLRMPSAYVCTYMYNIDQYWLAFAKSGHYWWILMSFDQCWLIQTYSINIGQCSFILINTNVFDQHLSILIDLEKDVNIDSYWWVHTYIHTCLHAYSILINLALINRSPGDEQTGLHNCALRRLRVGKRPTSAGIRRVLCVQNWKYIHVICRILKAGSRPHTSPLCRPRLNNILVDFGFNKFT